MRKNNKGFTLIEMLIVVAIIAILVAVSIPLVQNSLERARIATDAANERAAKAEAIILYLNGTWKDTNNQYDAADGTFKESVTKGYGKCATHKDGHIEVTLNGEGTVQNIIWQGSSITDSGAHNGVVD